MADVVGCCLVLAGAGDGFVVHRIHQFHGVILGFDDPPIGSCDGLHWGRQHPTSQSNHDPGDNNFVDGSGMTASRDMNRRKDSGCHDECCRQTKFPDDCPDRGTHLNQGIDDKIQPLEANDPVQEPDRCHDDSAVSAP